MLAIGLVVACLLFIIAYFKYGKFLTRHYEIDNTNPTPAHTLSDGIDYVPARVPVLFGHHFSSIAGAGPIVGPIIAGIAFGWGPAWLWIVLGSIFFGGVHDFSALITSIRHKARSIAEIANIYMSKRAYLLMLAFIWLAIVYVIIVFMDLTAATFKNDGGVATSSLLFILLAIGFGICLYVLKVPLGTATAIFVPLVFFSIWIGRKIPLENIPVVMGSVAKTWDVVLIFYCFVASVIPVWVLLQPRDYLSSFLLYISVIGGVIGILFGGLPINYPLFINWNAPGIGPLFPILFITVACGAISGFHSIVSSGTSSKQLDKESDALTIGYGAMLVEGVVAIIALSTVIVVSKDSPLTGNPPLVVYASGMAKFLNIFGIPVAFGKSFALLAISAFILTTLDTATRLARYIFQEFFNMRSKNSRFPATAITLILPAIFVLIDLKDASGKIVPAWKVIWPAFGATNQLLAGLALLVVAVWLKKKGRKNWFIVIPMSLMLVTTLWALVLLILRYKLNVIGFIAVFLFALALLLVKEAVQSLAR